MTSLLLCLAVLNACVYRIDVQQGNLLEDNDIDAVQVGMTRSQVRFVLGTPVVEDAFHHDRWDYIYYYRQGRSRVADRRWLIVYFDGERVREILKDVPTNPT
jgi:outer membrane protein assembly factor BamE